MKTTGPTAPRLPSSYLSDTDYVPPPVATALPAWRQVHDQLIGLAPTSSLAGTGGLATYHYCVYACTGQSPHAALARTWFEQLLAQRSPMPGPWPASQLEVAATVAWLSPRLHAAGLVPEPVALLAEADRLLEAEALRLLRQPDAPSRVRFFQVLRYFSLRLPVPAAQQALPRLLAAWPGQFDDRPSLAGPLLLDVASGLAGELLVLLTLAEAGFQDPKLTHYVRAGLLKLLTLKQEVDFLEQRYAVFPYQLLLHGASFSAELSWRRGDLGQVLLLYKAATVLQDDELWKMAELVGLNTLLRTSLPATEVRSAHLGCGASGVAYLYRYLYQLSGQPAYLTGYEFWLRQTQALLQAEAAAGTYARTYQAHAGELLHGLAGVGLVLLSATTTLNIGWEDMLL